MWKNKNEFLVYIIHYLCKEKSHTKSSLKAYIKDWNIKAKCFYCYAADLHSPSGLKQHRLVLNYDC